ncbi:MAG: hypothetical protein U0414_11980 [Polyangiaceae bacterium]
MTTTPQEELGETMWERAQRAAEARRREEGVEPGTLARLSHRSFGAPESALQAPKEDPAREEAVRRATRDHLREVAIAARDGAARDLWIGCLLFGIGIIATAVSYAMASEGTGGKYVVAWGAMLVGAIRFIQGLVRWMKAPQLPTE